jgi:hypothetical protein
MRQSTPTPTIRCTSARTRSALGNGTNVLSTGPICDAFINTDLCRITLRLPAAAQ